MAGILVLKGEIMDWFSIYMRALDNGYSEKSAARMANEYANNWEQEEEDE